MAAVSGALHSLEVRIKVVLGQVGCVRARPIIHQVGHLRRSLEMSLDFVHEGHKVLLICRVGQHETGLLQSISNRSHDGDTAEANRVLRAPHWVLSVLPHSLLAHRDVHTGFVHVYYGLLVIDQTAKLEGILLSQYLMLLRVGNIPLYDSGWLGEADVEAFVEVEESGCGGRDLIRCEEMLFALA